MKNLTVAELYEQRAKDREREEIKIGEDFTYQLRSKIKEYLRTDHDKETVTNTKTVKGVNGERVIEEETFRYSKSDIEMAHIILDERARSGLEDYINNWIESISPHFQFKMYRGLSCKCFIVKETQELRLLFKVPYTIKGTKLDIFSPFDI